MKVSGYLAKEIRCDLPRFAVMRKEEMERKIRAGEIKSLNRIKQEILSMKAAKGGIIASTWFLKGETTSVVKCQPTPGGSLAKRLKTALNPKGQKGRTHIVEAYAPSPVLDLGTCTSTCLIVTLHILLHFLFPY